MADATLRGAFELDAEQPIRQLHSIRDAGMEADNRLQALGRTMDRLPVRTQTSWSAMRSTIDREAGSIGRRIDELDAKLDRFARKSATASIDISGVDRANAQLTELEARLDRLDHRRVSPNVSMGGGFSNFAGGGGGVGGGARGGVFSSLGGIPGMLPWWAMAAPLAPTLLGGAGALVGSAGAGALGAGVVGLGGLGLLPGAAITAGMGKQAFSGLSNVTKAELAYQAAVQSYGAGSAQARTARIHLDQASSTAPRGAVGASRQLLGVRAAYQSATRPGMSSFYSSLAQGASSVRGAIPQLAPAANTMFGTAGASGAAFAKFLTDPQSIRSLQTLMGDFTREMPVMEGTLQNVTRLFFNLATDAMPFFHEADVWVNNWTRGLANQSQDSARVQRDMRGLVNSAKDWMHLLGASGRLLKDLFAPSVQSGNSMVVQLTGTLDRWDTWLRDNPQKVRGFFDSAVSGTERIATVIGNLTKDVWQIFSALSPILTRAEQFLKFASGLGGGNLALGGALLYGAYEGGRGALGGRGPSAGAALSTFVTGPGVRGSRGGRMVGGTIVAPSYSQATIGRASNLEVSRGVTSSGAFLMGPVTSGPEAVLARREAALAADESRVGRLVSGVRGWAMQRPFTAGALDVLGTAGGAARGVLGGAARFALPVLGINALLNAMQPTSGGLGAHLQNAASGATLGLIPSYVSPQAQGAQSAQRFLSALRPGVDPYGQIRQQIAQVSMGGAAGSARGAVVPIAGASARDSGGMLPVRGLSSPGTIGLSKQQAGEITALAQAQMNELATHAGNVRTPQQAASVRQMVAQVRLELPPSQAARFSKYLDQIASTAAQNAGGGAATSWESAFQTGLSHMAPGKAVSTALRGMPSQIASLVRSAGPEGARAFAADLGQWASQLQTENPQLRKPLQRLMNGVIDDINRTNHAVGHSFKALQDKVFYFNGQILTGSKQTWQAIGKALTDPSSVAQEKLSGIWGQIQQDAVDALTSMGFSRANATAIVTGKVKGGMAATYATDAVVAQSATPVKGGYSTTAFSNPTQAGQTAAHHARGGSLIGGRGLLDTVMMPDGSLAAPGEAYIANRHTMNDLTRATMQVFGKTAWQMIDSEHRAHSAPSSRRAAFGMTGGGGTPGNVVLDAGVNMSVGQEPQILTDLRALSSEVGKTVYVISGYRSPSHSVAVGGFANDPHTRGQAADIGVGSASRSSMFGITESALRAVGLYRPFYPGSAAEVNHVQLLNGGTSTGGRGIGGSAGATAAAVAQSVNLRAPRTGLGGIPGALGDQASAIMTAGMQGKVNAWLAANGGGGYGSGAISGGGNSAANQRLGRQMMLASGWPASEWPALQALWTQESGWNANAVNSSSGAAGIPQALGHGNVFALGDARAQIAWGLNYIRGRYGSPSAAEAHERSFNWYQRGGRQRWAGWNMAGGEFITDGPTLFGAGDRGRRERVSISPITRGRQNATGHRGIVLNFHGPVHFAGTKEEADRMAEYVAGKILDSLDSVGQGAADHQLMGAPS